MAKLYEMKNPQRFAGAWNEASILKTLIKDSLIDRGGCALYIQKDDRGNFHGSTQGKECSSTLRGASYTTSEISIYPNLMINLDQGFDKAGKQVWGAEKGGYRFRKFTINRPEEE